MGARRRALVILVSLMVATVGTALLLIAASGSLGPRSARRGTQVAETRAVDLGLFKGEVLVWAVGGLSPTEVARVRDSSRVAAISAVRTGLLPLASGKRAYPVIPVEAMSVDPDAYAVAAGRAGGAFPGMLARGVVLSRTGASLRKLRRGDHLPLTGNRSLTVGGVVDDRLLGGYEAAVDLERGHRLGIDHVGYLLLLPRGSRDTLEAAVRGLLHGRKVAFRYPDQGPWFRAGDVTLPLAQVKIRFGEFAVTSLAKPVPDPHWVQANIVTQTVPVLGQVRCHRRVVADLAAVMADLRRDHLEGLVDVAAFRRVGGCLQQRPGRARPAGLSPQAWGIAFDLTGAGAPHLDKRLIAAMARHGFSWGGRWLQRAPGRFQWVGAGA
ncbi:MAG TPA: M15 family metallopeptidase [Actinomycetes bacterium]|nr:M15 family metallopeptidase [Actinomycetes bacterium]